MNAVVQPRPMLLPMQVLDLDAVLALERVAYSHPWTRGNFIDSLHAGYLAQTLRDGSGALVGYYLAMPGVDEMHLLNLTVAPAWQRLGHARHMLDDLVDECRARTLHKLWLEVRVSNQRALMLYERYGFARVGVRRDYYPFSATQREDAVVMSLDVEPDRAGER
jgi:ribosomal-protein-alanine N-acetyltransferase